MRAIVGAALMFLAIGAGHPGAAQADAGVSHCILLLSGAGTLTDNDKVNGIWIAADHAVSNSVNDSLIARGFDVRYYFNTSQNASQQLAEAAWHLDETKCAKAIQVDRILGVENGKSFSYSVLIFHLDKKRVDGVNSQKVVGEYKKDYTYTLTEEVMRTLSLSGVGSRIAADIDASKVLEDMKAAAPPKPAT